MSTYTRRHWLKLAASLLSMIGALRKLFGPPPEVVDDRTIWDVIDEHKSEVDGPPEVLIDDPLMRKRMFLALLQKKGSIKLNVTGPESRTLS